MLFSRFCEPSCHGKATWLGCVLVAQFLRVVRQFHHGHAWGSLHSRVNTKYKCSNKLYLATMPFVRKRVLRMQHALSTVLCEKPFPLFRIGFLFPLGVKERVAGRQMA